jgi:hypothetical protein
VVTDRHVLEANENDPIQQFLFDTMLNFVENLLENERDPRSGPMNDQDHSLSLSDPDRSLVLSHFLTNFVENLLENERDARSGPMNDQDLTKTDYDPDRSLVLIEGLSHFLTNFLQNLASCQTSFNSEQTVFTEILRTGYLNGRCSVSLANSSSRRVMFLEFTLSLADSALAQVWFTT